MSSHMYREMCQPYSESTTHYLSYFKPATSETTCGIKYGIEMFDFI